jgi:hypothetical protein
LFHQLVVWPVLITDDHPLETVQAGAKPRLEGFEVASAVVVEEHNGFIRWSGPDPPKVTVGLVTSAWLIKHL